MKAVNRRGKNRITKYKLVPSAICVLHTRYIELFCLPSTIHPLLNLLALVWPRLSSAFFRIQIFIPFPNLAERSEIYLQRRW